MRMLAIEDDTGTHIQMPRSRIGNGKQPAFQANAIITLLKSVLSAVHGAMNRFFKRRWLCRNTGRNVPADNFSIPEMLIGRKRFSDRLDFYHVLGANGNEHALPRVKKR